MAFDLFHRAIAETSKDGWGSTHQSKIENGKLVPRNDVDQLDRMWGQAYYGLYVASLPETEKISRINMFVNACDNMLLKTGGVWLRDIAAIDKWKFDPGEWEASKDQMIGMVTCLFIMFHATNHEVLKQDIRCIAKQIDDQLADHKWILWNEPAKRANRSPNLAYMHYWGISKALRVILEKPRFSIMDLICRPLSWIMPYLNITLVWRTKQIVNPATRSQSYWWQRLPDWKPLKFLLNKPWYGPYFRAGCFDYGIQLSFFEMLINGWSSKSWAKKIIKLLDRDESVATNNVNLAALYLGLKRIHNLTDKETPKSYAWSIIVDSDDVMHGRETSYTVLPNGLGIGFQVPDNKENSLWGHEIRPLATVDNTRSPGTGSQYDLLTKSTWANPGLTYLGRRWLRTGEPS